MNTPEFLRGQSQPADVESARMRHPSSGAATADTTHTSGTTNTADSRRGAPGQMLAARPRLATVDVVIPVYNEERALAQTVRTLRAKLDSGIPYPARIIIANNASTDSTARIADDLVRSVHHVKVVHVPEKGRGRALKRAWLNSDADVVAYMDVDLSTDLDALLPLLAPLVSGHSDIAIGTRLSRSSRVTRGPKREFISRSYNFLIRATVGSRFSDAQCGFKAMRTDASRRLLPLVEDDGWFFDTETLILAERAGLRIHEVPVDWVDDPDSRVDIVSTAMADMRGLWRVGTGLALGRIDVARVRAGELNDEALLESGHLDSKRDGAAAATARDHSVFRQFLSFGMVGVASTVAFACLFLLLRPGMGAQVANVTSLLVTAIGNTAANRYLTFRSQSGRSARSTWLRDHSSGLGLMFIALALTSGSLWLLHSLAPGAGRGAELAVLTAANVTATLLRFVGLKAVMSR